MKATDILVITAVIVVFYFAFSRRRSPDENDEAVDTDEVGFNLKQWFDAKRRQRRYVYRYGSPYSDTSNFWWMFKKKRKVNRRRRKF